MTKTPQAKAKPGRPKRVDGPVQVINIYMPISLCTEIDRIIGDSGGRFSSRSAFIRHAVEQQILKDANAPTKPGVPGESNYNRPELGLRTLTLEVSDLKRRKPKKAQ